MNSKRLLAAAAFIEKKDNVIDVGCDHAYLATYLYLNNLCNKVVASDISKGALNQAKKTLTKNGLNDKIELIYSDGLKNVSDNSINTAVICGMGASTILSIIQNNKLNINKYILGSNNDLPLLRDNMNKMGYRLFKETLIYENNKYYFIGKYIPGKQKLNYFEKQFGLYSKKNKDYYKTIFDKNLFIIKSLPKYRIKCKLKYIYQNILLLFVIKLKKEDKNERLH